MEESCELCRAAAGVCGCVRDYRSDMSSRASTSVLSLSRAQIDARLRGSRLYESSEARGAASSRPIASLRGLTGRRGRPIGARLGAGGPAPPGWNARHVTSARSRPAREYGGRAGRLRAFTASAQRVFFSLFRQ